MDKAYIEIVEGGRMPAKAHATDAAYDCFAREVEEVTPGIWRCALGFRLELPVGWFADLRPRSSIWKSRLWLSNSCGIVDAGYRGEVQAFFYAKDSWFVKLAAGDRVAQMMIRKLDEIELIATPRVRDNSERGEGGFGSTGK